MKITIIGAGSPYTPELVQKLAEEQGAMPVGELCLMDIDEKRLEIMHGFCRRYGKRLGLRAEITATTDRERALDGADFVNTQIRVGGNKARARDERIAISLGLVGQETTGAGGFMKGMRTIPVMLGIAHEMERRCPDAWMINYTNPTGLVTEAVNKYSKAKMVGLCSGGFHARWVTSKALGVEAGRVRYDLFGLNHLSFAHNITVDGRSLTDEEFEKVAEAAGSPGKDIVMMIRAVPIGYLDWYFHTEKKMAELKAAPLTRGEQVLALEDELYAAFADPACDSRPAVLDKRGGGGYADVAISAMKAIWLDEETWLPANVPNRGTVPFLPDDAVIETMCWADAGGFRPVAVPGKPPHLESVRGLVCAVKNYEQLAVEAAVTGNREKALLALMAHPLVGDYDVAKEVLGKMGGIVCLPC